MRPPDEIRNSLNQLKTRLEQVNSAWTMSDYESLLKFFIGIVPKIMDAERCSIFIAEPGTDDLWLKFGTGLQEKEIVPTRQGTIVGETITTGKVIIRNDLEHQPGFHADLAPVTNFITRNLACAPIRSLTEHGITGAVEVLNKKGGGAFSLEDGERLQDVANYLSMAIENILVNHEILKISDRLNREIEQLWESDLKFVAESRIMQNILDTVRVVSATPVNVLIHGESGTGKEVIARMIHKGSSRGNKPFVPVNCASIPETLMESEFFGYEKGAFTGAVASRKGRFEEADGGILFLDEIGDLPFTIQPKFLRVLQEGEGNRLGSNQTLRYDLRFISASNKDLQIEVKEGRFREDLFYRIFSVEIRVPPLRERPEDIVPLATLFMDRVSKQFKKKIRPFSSETLNFFEAYSWPGNVRQLLHEIERMVALTPEGESASLKYCSQELQRWSSSRPMADLASRSVLTLPTKIKELEIACIRDALHKTEGNKVRASRILGITRQGLDKKLKRYEIRPLKHTGGISAEDTSQRIN